MDLLKSYQQYQAEYAKSLGYQWENHDRLFIKWNGFPIFPNTPALFFGRFCKRHGIRYINPHGWRHFCVSA